VGITILDRRDSGSARAIKSLTDKIAAARVEGKEKNWRFEQAREALLQAHPEGLSAAGFEQSPEFKATADARDEYEKAGQQLEALEKRLEALALDTDADRLPAPGDPKAGRWLASAISTWKQTMGGELDPMRMNAALVTSTGLGDAISPPESANYFFDLLAPRSIGLLSGFSIITTERVELRVPRLVGDVPASWVEEGEPIPEGDPDGDLVTVKPQKLAARATITREAFNDSNPAALAITEFSMIRQMSLGVDAGFFFGSGTEPELQGIANTPGAGAIDLGVNGAELDNLDPFAEAIGQLEQENAQASAIYMAPRDWKQLLKLKESSADNNKPLLEQAGGGTEGVKRSIYGVPVYLSSQFPTDEEHGTADNASRIIVAEAPQIVAVRRQEVELAVDPFYDFDADKVGVRVIARWGVVVPNPKAIVLIVGVIPPPAP
jgi:HK97 family phage major capsid protein